MQTTSKLNRVSARRCVELVLSAVPLVAPAAPLCQPKPNGYLIHPGLPLQTDPAAACEPWRKSWADHRGGEWTVAYKGPDTTLYGGYVNNGWCHLKGPGKYGPVDFGAEVLQQGATSCPDDVVPKACAAAEAALAPIGVPPGMQTSHPIALATAAKLLVEQDLGGHGGHALGFIRHYASRWNEEPAALIGTHWSHNHSHRNITRRNERTVLLGDGRVSRFVTSQSTPPRTWTAVGSLDTMADTSEGVIVQFREDDSQWVFDSSTGMVKSSQMRNGWTTQYLYAAGRLQRVTNHFGRALDFAYDEQGRLSSVVATGGEAVRYAYDANSRLTGVTYADGSTRTYLHEEAAWPAAITGIVDAAGNRWGTFAYDPQGRAVSSELAGGADRVSVAYGTSSSTMTDALGTNRTFQYQRLTGAGSGLVPVGSSSPSADGNSMAAQTFDANSLLASQTDFMGATKTFTWDAARRLPLTSTEAAGRPEARTTQLQWHPTMRLPTVTTEAGRTVSREYDAAGRVLSVTTTDTDNGGSRTRSWTYSPQGLVETMTDERGGVWRYAHDASGNMLTETNPVGHQTSYTHDAAGRVVTRSDANGLSSNYYYDSRDRLISLSKGALNTSFTYEPTGQLASVSLPSGLGIYFQYDAAQRLIGWEDTRGARGSYSLDLAGNRTLEEVRDGNGNLVHRLARAVNAINRVTAETLGPGQTELYGYDANGELASITNALSQSTVLTRDGLKRVAGIRDPNNATASMGRDPLDSLTSATDFKGVATAFVRNGFGEAMAETSPDAGSRTTEYNAAGDITEATDGQGQVTRIQRDLLGRPTRLEHADGTATDLRYDVPGSTHNAPGSPNASRGRLSEIREPAAVTQWQWDALGRVTRRQQVLANGAAQALQYAYNPRGLLQTITYPSGGRLEYSYNATGEIEALSWNGEPLVSGLRWNALGQPLSWTWTFGVPVPARRTYDTAGRMVETEFGAYQWDTAGRLNTIYQDLQLPSGEGRDTSSAKTERRLFQVGYDATGRVTSFTEPGEHTNFEYDANGNRLSSIWRSGANEEERAYAIESFSNRLLGYTATARGPGGNSSYTVQYQYAADGAILHDGRRAYQYDARGRLALSTRVGGQGGATKYAHNALGERVFKTEPLHDQDEISGDEEVSVWDRLFSFVGRWWKPEPRLAEKLGWAYIYGENGSLMGEYGSGGPSSTGSTEYIWLPTASGPMPIAAVKNAQIYAVHADHLNTPRRVTDAAATAVWEWKYSAFGEEKPTIADDKLALSGGSLPRDIRSHFEFNLRYPGQYADSENGLHYNYRRTLDPDGGRYTQPDPTGVAGGWNKFIYANGNPLAIVDPRGLSPEDVEKIIGTVQSTVDGMTAMGRRNINPYFNNVSAALNRASGGKWGSPYLGCGDQETVVSDQLEKRSYQDAWTFSRKSDATHKWGEARSSNPSDPVIVYDPWHGKITLLP